MIHTRSFETCTSTATAIPIAVRALSARTTASGVPTRQPRTFEPPDQYQRGKRGERAQNRDGRNLAGVQPQSAVGASAGSGLYTTGY